MTNEESIFLESGLLEQYALNLCSPKESEEVEGMLGRSEEVRRAYDELQKDLELLAKVKAVKPPEHLRDEILSFIKESAGAAEVFPLESKTHEPLDRHPNLWAIAAGLALLVSLGFLFRQYQNTQGLKAELDALRAVQSTSEQRLDALETELAFLQDLNTRPLILSTSGDEGPFKVTAYWNEREGRVLLDTKGVPPAPEGKCYQLWADVDGEMMSVAVLSPEGQSLTPATYYPQATSLNITMEDAPGSDHATLTALVVSVEV
ncbi:MAG: anti-sigma factor [Bacteroidetes bacterium]|nr:anti-sigma factor [Bacteroidota bacterium]